MTVIVTVVVTVTITLIVVVTVIVTVTVTVTVTQAHHTRSFAMQEGPHEWFLGDVQKRARPAKNHFWAKFEDGEYKCTKLSETPLSPSQKNGYGNTWLLVKAK